MSLSPLHQTTNPLFTTHLTILRDTSIPSSRVRSLVHSLSQILVADTLSTSPPVNLTSASSSARIALIPVLRSGLSMTDAFLSHFEASLPAAKVSVYHLGLFREKGTLEPVEYYNKLPVRDASLKHAYILDPLLATGGTAAAVISILKDWGIERVTFIAILASEPGLARARSVWPEGVDFIVGAVDPDLDAKGYVKPGVGDIGDRLYGTSLG